MIPRESTEVVYLEDATFPNHFGAIWEDKKVMLVRNMDMGIDEDNQKCLFQWHTDNMCFLHIGRPNTLNEALTECGLDEVFQFDTLVELATWMES